MPAGMASRRTICFEATMRLKSGAKWSIGCYGAAVLFQTALFTLTGFLVLRPVEPGLADELGDTNLSLVCLATTATTSSR